LAQKIGGIAPECSPVTTGFEEQIVLEKISSDLATLFRCKELLIT